MSVTRLSLLTEIQNQVGAATAGINQNQALTDQQIKDCFNAVFNSLDTVDPSKKPTVKHVIDLEF